MKVWSCLLTSSFSLIDFLGVLVGALGGALAAFRDTTSTLVVGFAAFGLRIFSLRYHWQTRAVRHDA